MAWEGGYTLPCLPNKQLCACLMFDSTHACTTHEALELGVRGTKLLQGFFSALSRPTFGERLCPHCGNKIPSNYYEHLFSSHLPESKYSTETTIQWLENKNFHDLINLAEKISCLKFTD